MSAPPADLVAREGNAYWAGYEAGETAQRHADASKVRADGCLCLDLEWGTFQGVLRWVFSEVHQELESHDPRCPEALADLILEGGE